MKRLTKLLALALALVLIALPTAALAESVEVYKLMISNPQVFMNGASAGDLSGLGIEGSVYETDNAGVLRLRLFGGDVPAADAYASFDGRQLLLGADGISNIYSVPIEKLPFYSEMMEQMMMVAALVSEETLIAVSDAIEGPLERFSDKIEASLTDEEATLIDHATGPVEMEGETITIRAEDWKALIDEISAGLDAIPAVKQLLDAADDTIDYDLEKGLESEDIFAMFGDMSVTTWTAVYDPTSSMINPLGMPIRIEIRMQMNDPTNPGAPIDLYAVGDMYMGDDGRMVEELTATGTQNGVVISEGSGIAYFGFTADGLSLDYDIETSGQIDGGMRSTSTVNMYLHPAGYTPDNPDRTVFGMTSVDTYGSDTTSFNLSGYYAPADGENYAYDEFALSMYGGSADDNFMLELITQNQHEDGQEYYGMQITAGEDDEIYSMYYTFEGTYEENAFGGEDRAGALRLGAGDGTTTFELAADIELAHTAEDAASLPSFDGVPINALTMGEKEMDQLNREGEMLGMRLLGTLSSKVPGIGLLMNAGMF